MKLSKQLLGKIFFVRTAGFLLAAFVLTAPLLALAYENYPKVTNGVDHGMIPCGFADKGPDGKILTRIGKDGSTVLATYPCEVGHIFEFINDLITFLLFTIAAPLAVLSLVLSGIYMVVNSGNPGELAKAKTTIWNILFGFAMAFTAWALVSTIVRLVAPESGIEQYINR